MNAQLTTFFKEKQLPRDYDIYEIRQFSFVEPHLGSGNKVLKTQISWKPTWDFRKVKGNYTLFMTKEPSKAILNRSRFKISNLNLLSCKNVLVFKRQKNISNFPTTKGKKVYFSKITSFGVRQNKNLQDTVKPFFTSKGFEHNENNTINIIYICIITYISIFQNLWKIYIWSNSVFRRSLFHQNLYLLTEVAATPTMFCFN